MARASFEQTSFLGGAWSLNAQGRTDQPAYRTAMKTCLNGQLLETGSWTRRPGTLHCGYTRQGQSGRLLKFDFQDNIPHSMEFTTLYMRLWRGKQLSTNNDAVTISSISSATPAVVTTSAAFGTTGQAVRIDGLGTLCPTLQNKIFIITKTGSTTFTMVDEVTGVAVDGATLGWSTPGTLPTVSSILEISTVYNDSAWPTIRAVQTNEQAVLFNQAFKPYVVKINSLPTNTTDAVVSIDAAVFQDGPYLDPFTNGAQITPSGVTGVINLTLGFQAYDSTRSYAKDDYVTSSSVNYQSLVDNNLNHTPASSPSYWGAVSAGAAVGPNGFQGTDIGRMLRLYSEPPAWVTGVGNNYVAGNVVAFGGTYWTALKSMTGIAVSTGQTDPNQPGLQTTTWAINPQAARWTWGKITGLATVIAGATGTAIGTLTGDGGLSAAFDGALSKAYSSCATKLNTNSMYIGKHFSGGAQAIGSVTLYPSTDQGFVNTGFGVNSFYFQLYGSANAPDATMTNGTLLGSYNVGNTDINNAISITSNDQVTTWNYVWVFVHLAAASTPFALAISQMVMFNPTGTGTGTTVSFQILGDNLLYTTAIRTWRMGLYSDTTGWPTTGVYHEGRLWFASLAQRNRFDASCPIMDATDHPTGVFNMAPTASDGTVSDGNAISYTLNADEVNSIYWMKSVQQGVLMGTQAGEWLVTATANNNVLTPTSIQAHRVTRSKCANIEPRDGPMTTFVVQAKKRKVLEYFADVFSGKFLSPNLSLNAAHLMKRGIEEIAYQHELTPTLWCRMTDGTLTGAAYKRESLFSSQGPTFIGWHEHTLGSGRLIESICESASVNADLNTIMMVTNDTNTNVRHIEMLTDVFTEGTALTSAWFLDNAVTPVVTHNIVFGGNSTMQCSGLAYLEGKTVTVFAGGLDCGDYTVTNGVVSVPYAPAAVQTNPLFTYTFVQTFTTLPVVVGFTYTSKGQLLRLDTPQDSGARNGPAFGKKRRIDTAIFNLVDTQGFSYGTDFTRLTTANFVSDGGTPYAANALFSGIFRDTNKGNDSYDQQLGWQVTRPLPCTVAAAGGFVDTKDV